MKTKQLKPLSVNSIVEILNSHKYSIDYLTQKDVLNPNRFRLIDYNKVVRSFLDYFYIDYKLKNLPTDDSYYGSYVALNEKINNYYFDDMYRIEFTSLYPHIIVKLWKEKKIELSINEFGNILSFLIENRKQIKQHPDLTKESYLILRIFINFTYGSIFSTMVTLITCTNKQLITLYTKDVFSELMEKYPKNIIYIDTDCIYLDYLTNDIKTYIDSLDLPYTITSHIGGYFTKVKKYITYEKDGIHVRGIQTYKSPYKMEKGRINKLRKIKSLING